MANVVFEPNYGQNPLQLLLQFLSVRHQNELQKEQLNIQKERLKLEQDQQKMAQQKAETERLAQGQPLGEVAALLAGSQGQQQAMQSPAFGRFASMAANANIGNPELMGPAKTALGDIGTRMFQGAQNTGDIARASRYAPISPQLMQAKTEELAGVQAQTQQTNLIEGALKVIPEKYRNQMRAALTLRSTKLLPETEYSSFLERAGVPLPLKDRVDIAFKNQQIANARQTLSDMRKNANMRAEFATRLGIQAGTVPDAVITDFVKSTHPEMRDPQDIAVRFALGFATKVDALGNPVFDPNETLNLTEQFTRAVTGDSNFSLTLTDADRAKFTATSKIQAFLNLRRSEGKKENAIRNEAMKLFQQDFPTLTPADFNEIWGLVAGRIR